MARDDFESLVEAVRHVESRGRRYAADAKTLLTSHKGAQGEMQVMPKTQRSPGFGVEPAKPGDPEEIARVGRDYLKAMLDKYGDRDHALAAYNWGPGKVDKWLAQGADPAKLPEETRNYLVKVNKQLGTKTANVPRETPQPQTEAEKVMEPALRAGQTAQAPVQTPAASQQLAELGPNYQAALALSVLADVDEEERKDRDVDDDSQPSVAQKWLAEQGSRPSALASLSDISIKSPFPEPVRMADGGDVEEDTGADAGEEYQQPPLPDLPAKEMLRTFKFGHRGRMAGANVESGVVGAEMPVGEGRAAILGNISKMSKDDKEQLARAMLAELTQNFGDVGVRAGLVKPFGPGTKDVYMGDVGASYPLGEGRVTGSVLAGKMPGQPVGVTGYSLGYSGKVGPGTLSGGVTFPRHGSPQGQIMYQIPLGRADGGDVREDDLSEARDRSTMTVDMGTAKGRLEEFNKLDPMTQEALLARNPQKMMGIAPAPQSKDVPFTLSTMPGARAVYDTTLEDTGTRGYVHSAFREGKTGPLAKDVIFLQPGREKMDERHTRAHEAEHLLARRGLGHATRINDKFDELMGNDVAARDKFVRDAIDVRNHLEQNYGITSSYFDPRMYKIQGSRAPNLFYEQAAELSAAEQNWGVDLTKDPVLRKTLFSDPKVRQAYNAVTGLRQTRLDARDLPTYTPQPEKAEGVMSLIRQKLGFADGGDVSRPATFNPMIRRQGEAARRLAAMRDVNTLPDPKTYAAVSSFLGTAPDELGFSVMHPKYQEIQDVAKPAFIAGTAAGIAPAAQLLKAPTVAAGMRLEKALEGPVTRTLEGGGRSAEMLKALGASPSYAIRTKGGNWVQDLTREGTQVDPIENYLRTQVGLPNDEPLKDWMLKKMGNYMRREMGTEGDQFVRAAEQGKRLHFMEKPGPNYRFDFKEEGFSSLPHRRVQEGFPSQGFAQTEYGKAVEARTDAPVWPMPLRTAVEDYPKQIPPALVKAGQASPEERIHELSVITDSNLGLSELVDKMLGLRNLSKEVSFYQQPPVKIPEQYLFSNKTLEGLTPAQASERVAQFDRWQQDTKQRMASQALLKDKNLDKVKLDDTHTAVTMPDLEMNPKMRELTMDVGCDGGWCTDKEHNALDYGSGDNRLTIILDKKARPKAQITVSEIQPTVDSFFRSLPDEEYRAFVSKYPASQDWGFDMRTTPEFNQWLALNPTRLSITEIKGVNNSIDFANQSYLPAIQKFVKDMDANHDLMGVTNLDKIGMRDVRGVVRGMMKNLGDPAAISPENIKRAEANAVQLNGGSKYIVNNAADYDEVVNKAIQQVLGQ